MARLYSHYSPARRALRQIPSIFGLRSGPPSNASNAVNFWPVLGPLLSPPPEVTCSVKPSCDGRADKSVAQRGIVGFEPRAARHGYIYNPERNPSLDPNVAPP